MPQNGMMQPMYIMMAPPVQKKRRRRRNTSYKTTAKKRCANGYQKRYTCVKKRGGCGGSCKPRLSKWRTASQGMKKGERYGQTTLGTPKGKTMYGPRPLVRRAANIDATLTFAQNGC